MCRVGKQKKNLLLKKMLDFPGQTVFYSADDNRVKCGEIFRHTDGSFALICVYCTHLEFEDYSYFMQHINSHYNLIGALDANNENTDCIPSFSGSDKTTTVDDKVPDEYAEQHESYIETIIPELPISSFVSESAAPRRTKNGKTRKLRQVPELMCDYCKIFVPHKKHLRQHMLLVHSYGVGCTYCSLQFKNTHQMINHVKSVHNKERPYACQHCDKSFSTASSLISHTRYHFNDRPFLCSTCGRRFILKNQLNVHLLRVHVPKYDPQHRRFPCHLCDYKTGFQFKLEEHLKTHSNVRNFSCDHCERLFKSAKSLRQHSQLHTGEKRFKCKYCGLKFAQSAGKRGHERNRHEKVDIKLEDFEEHYLDIE